MREGGSTLSGDRAEESAESVFAGVLADLRAGQDDVRAARPEITFEDLPAPRTLAPYAAALGASVHLDGAEVASGRFVVLYDPASQRGWTGPLRVIVYLRAEMEPEIVSDPMVGQVAWSWLTEALQARTSGYAEPSGTVTRVITEGFGAKREEPPAQGFELRASWSPVTDMTTPGLDAHLAAWCGTLCAAAGLPPLVAGVTALRPAARRRNP